MHFLSKIIGVFKFMGLNTAKFVWPVWKHENRDGGRENRHGKGIIILGRMSIITFSQWDRGSMSQKKDIYKAYSNAFNIINHAEYK